MGRMNWTRAKLCGEIGASEFGRPKAFESDIELNCFVMPAELTLEVQ